MCEKKVFTEYCDKAPKDCKINSEVVVVQITNYCFVVIREKTQ